jgi:hypothetical protein
MRSFCFLASLAAIAGCSPANDAADAPAEPAAIEATTSEPNTPIGNLVGEYRVAGINGESIDAPFGLALSVTDSRMIFGDFCGGYAWDYRLEGTRIEMARVASPDAACLATVRMHRSVFDFVEALDAVTTATRTPSNGIELAGAGRSVTLYSQ